MLEDCVYRYFASEFGWSIAAVQKLSLGEIAWFVSIRDA